MQRHGHGGAACGGDTYSARAAIAADAAIARANESAACMKAILAILCLLTFGGCQVAGQIVEGSFWTNPNAVHISKNWDSVLRADAATRVWVHPSPDDH